MKVLLMGQCKSGKTSLWTQLVIKGYAYSYVPTIGVDFTILFVKRGEDYQKVNLWDTSGQERFGSVTNCYIPNSDIVLFVIDVTDPDSLQ